MNGTRVLLFRGLTVIAAGLLALSWFLPWWRAHILEKELLGSYMQVNPWGLNTNLPQDYRPYYNAWLMPDWFAPLMWAFFGLLIALLLFSLFARDKKLNFLGRIELSLPQLIVLAVGLLYVVTVAGALVVLSIRVNDFTPGFKLIGETFISLGGALEGWMGSNFELGFWLACAAGPMLILLALFRNKIIGAR